MSAGEQIVILVVADNPDHIDRGADLLERTDGRFTVETATSASEGLDRVAEERFDCIVSDYDMPGQNGIAFFEAVHEAVPELPFVLLVDGYDEDVAYEALSRGVSECLPKCDEENHYESLGNRLLDLVERGRDRRGPDANVADVAALKTELEKPRNLFDQLFEQTPIHLYVKDEEARHVWMTNTYGELPEDAIGKTDRELFPEAGEETYADDMRVIETGEPLLDKEEYIPSADSWNLTSKVPWYGDSGEIKGLIGVTRNIDERKADQQQLERQNDRLKQFANIIAHDLRTPLMVMSGRLELVRTECDSAHLDEIRHAIERTDQLLEELLVLAREGEVINELTSVDLAAVVEDCWKTVPTQDATLQCGVDAMIRADRPRLAQALQNLLNNAIEHSGPGITVVVGELEDENGFYLEDDGSGIPADERERIFEEGYSESDSSIGLGLAIVREIVEAHEWEIKAAESDDGGARFEITGVTFR